MCKIERRIRTCSSMNKTQATYIARPSAQSFPNPNPNPLRNPFSDAFHRFRLVSDLWRFRMDSGREKLQFFCNFRVWKKFLCYTDLKVKWFGWFGWVWHPISGVTYVIDGSPGGAKNTFGGSQILNTGKWTKLFFSHKNPARSTQRGECRCCCGGRLHTHPTTEQHTALGNRYRKGQSQRNWTDINILKEMPTTKTNARGTQRGS